LLVPGWRSDHSAGGHDPRRHGSIPIGDAARIAAGYDADLVAVAGNPLHQLEALLDVRAVVRMGRLVGSEQVGI
jgi:hypothetical protein